MSFRTLIILAAVFCCCGIVLAQEQAEPEGGGGPFEGTFWDSVWTVVAFLSLLVVLGRFAWKPMLNGLQARQDHIQGEIDEAEENNKKAMETLSKYQAQLENVHDEGRKIVQSYTKMAEKESDRIISEAGEQARQIRQKAERDIERAKMEAEAELLESSGDMVIRLGEEILGRVITPDDNRRLINDAIEKLRENNG